MYILPRDTTFCTVIWFLLIIALTLYGSLLGQFGTVTFGVMGEYVNHFKDQNDEYEIENGKLKKTNEKLKSEVDRIEMSITELTKSTEQLKQRLQEFEGIRQHLSGICDENQDVHDLVDSLNEDIGALRLTVIHNEKTALLFGFYQQCYRGEQDRGLNRQEYKRFLSGFGVEQRGYFTEKGTFDKLAGDDGIIDMKEFQALVDEIITKYDEEMIRISSK